MSYQVLARKWRPQTFAELVGQQHVLQALVHALENNRLHHAYLFTGTRGVGKTTIARILARALNCEEGVSPTPCGRCGACQEISQGRFVDLIEVDAASRTKVEDTRELLENVQYAPSKGRFKVYLIDEVHMLSTHSFNALLKTLEEPPAHVKFLFATTDPQKLPVTVLSRCLQFNLRNMTPAQIANYLGEVLGKETIDFDTDALALLANSAQGSMRDALSLTDQAIAYGRGEVRTERVVEMLGTIDRGRVVALVETLLRQDAQDLFNQIEQIASMNPDYEQVLDETLRLLHQLALAQAVPSLLRHDDKQAQLKQMLATSSAEDIQLFYQCGLVARRDLALAPDPRIGFEMAFLRMLAFVPKIQAPERLASINSEQAALRAGSLEQVEPSQSSVGTQDAAMVRDVPDVTKTSPELSSQTELESEPQVAAIDASPVPTEPRLDAEQNVPAKSSIIEGSSQQNFSSAPVAPLAAGAPELDAVPGDMAAPVSPSTTSVELSESKGAGVEEALAPAAEPVVEPVVEAIIEPVVEAIIEPIVEHDVASVEAVSEPHRHPVQNGAQARAFPELPFDQVWQTKFNQLGLQGMLESIVYDGEMRANDDGWALFLAPGQRALWAPDRTESLAVKLATWLDGKALHIDFDEHRPNTPKKWQAEQLAIKTAYAVQVLQQDPFVQAIVGQFAGQLETNTVIPSESDDV